MYPSVSSEQSSYRYSISNKTLNVIVGDVLDIYGKIKPSNATVQSFHFQSSDPAIVEASDLITSGGYAYGTITAKTTGTVTITVTLNNNFTDSITVNVAAPSISNLKVSGLPYPDYFLRGQYDYPVPYYYDPSTIKWYRKNDSSRPDAGDAIKDVQDAVYSGGIYRITEDDLGKYISWGVTLVDYEGNTYPEIISEPQLITSAQDEELQTSSFTGVLDGKRSFQRPDLPSEDVSKVYDSSDITTVSDDKFNYFYTNVTPKISGKYSLWVDQAALKDLGGRDVSDSVLFLYKDSFDPNQPLKNLIAGNDDTNPSTHGHDTYNDADRPLSYMPDLELEANANYVLVLSTFANGVTGDLSFKGIGPGELSITIPSPLIPIDDQKLSDVYAGYIEGKQETKTISVSMTGTDDVNNIATSLSGANADAFGITQPAATKLQTSEPSTTFNVYAKNNLPPGTYTALVTVSGDQITPVTFHVEQVVQPNDSPILQSVVPGDSHAVVTWQEVPGASAYKVYKSLAPDSYGTLQETVGESVYQLDITGLANGVTYYFSVSAIKGDTESAHSGQMSARPQIPAPGAPTILSAVGGDRKVSLTWSPVDTTVGYSVYSSEFSGSYGENFLVVGGTEANVDVPGLINGHTYYFIVKAVNAGGSSEPSQEVSATPLAVPAAPTDVTATAGNGKATVSFTPSADNGGSVITSYLVKSVDGQISVTGSESPMTIPNLTNGISYSFTVQAINSVGEGLASDPSNVVTPYKPHKNSSGSGSTSTSTPSANESSTPSQGADVLVNSKAESVGYASTAQVGGRIVTSVVLDPVKMKTKLDGEGQGAIITIPVHSDSDVVIGELNGQLVHSMEEKQAVIEVKTDLASYSLPAQQINIQAISKQLGQNVDLKQINIRIQIAKPAADAVKLVKDSAEQGRFKIVVQPVEFTVTGSYEGKDIEISKFDAYVERSIAIPDDVDPSQITTAIVVEQDGSVRHVPTKIVQIGGHYYAKINSLTNSLYAVVWHPLEFKDVEEHWAKQSINDLGSRMIIDGVSSDRFNPDQSITRSEFAAILVRGLGLKLTQDANSFRDVNKTDWYNAYIQTAYTYHLVNGFEDNRFVPEGYITREQAMSMIANAMKLTRLPVGSQMPASQALAVFEDMNAASDWAKDNISACFQAGIVSGRSDVQLAPQEHISRAEVAVIIQRLLQKSGLID
ncbi:S-layer homology domain-containing protein [Paenibacillus sp. TAB 01]|uniref:S-layer homology domain-containing protein n=1 Tax=Paenibacillus sp. TAB 01 TaxID=3368988 RepID=UPI0037503F09